MANAINYNKHIWEGWTVQAFIDELTPSFKLIMSGRSWQERFKNRGEVEKWCKDNQPYYKKHIPDVVEHFCQNYNIR